MSITLAKSIAAEPRFNLYLRETGTPQADGLSTSYELVMPKDLHLHQRRRTGLALGWTVDPEATGVAGILDAINPGGQFAAATSGATITHPDYGRDQDGRHFRRS